MQKIKKILLRTLAVIIGCYILLLIPSSENIAVIKPAARPFAWNQDSMWQLLENDFVSAKKQSKQLNDSLISTLFIKEMALYKTVAENNKLPGDPVFAEMLQQYFKLAALIAANPNLREAFIQHFNRVRNLVKMQSLQWEINSPAARNTVYQLLYGMRAAEEEVLLQTGNLPFAPAMLVKDEASAAPQGNLFGIPVHSGDLLVSRGGAEVSALISRGNNYPGNFSHVALLYIDAVTNIPYLVEAHIEKGVAVSSAEQYIKDKKLRFMVLRARADQPSMIADPLLPHKAAKAAYEQALRRHIPYDFKMDFHDSTALFCSEVASHAYGQMGLQLWQASSTISSQGVVNWLSDFGVEHFVTQMPSDLEYDPQLSVVAEWRNPETLWKDHVDNAVMDAMLEQADKGKTIGYNHWMLPIVRVVKGWCMIKNAFGGVGIIPEGMSATRALKNQRFVWMYKMVKDKTLAMAEQFKNTNGYLPPYWQLVSMAKRAATDL